MTKEEAKKEYSKICNIKTFGLCIDEIIDIENYKRQLENIINKRTKNK